MSAAAEESNPALPDPEIPELAPTSDRSDPRSQYSVLDAVLESYEPLPDAPVFTLAPVAIAGSAELRVAARSNDEEDISVCG
jgi:hypothetical protein